MFSSRVAQGVLALLVSLLLLGIVASFVDGQQVLHSLSHARPGWLAASLAFTVVTFLLRGLRFSLLCERAGWLDTFAAVCMQSLALRVTPFRAGELALPYVLNRSTGEPMGQVIIRLLLVRVLELAVLLLTAAITLGLWLGGKGDQQTVGVLWIGAVLVGATVVSFRVWLRWAIRLLGWVVGRSWMPLRAKLGPIVKKLHDAASAGAHLTATQMVGLICTTLLTHAAQFVALGSILLALNIPVGALQVLAGASIAQIAGALPVATVGSVGTFEGGWTAGFVLAGVSLDAAALSGIAAQVLTLLYSMLLATFAYLLRLRAIGARPATQVEDLAS